MPLFYETCKGPIDGLSLPHNAWEVLRRENIETLDQLKAVVDRLEQFEGIGPKTARVIRGNSPASRRPESQPPAEVKPSL